MAVQKFSSVRAAAILAKNANTIQDYRDCKEFLLSEMEKARKEGQPWCVIFEQALQGLLEQDTIVQQNVVSEYALIRTDDIRPLEELIRENANLSKKLQATRVSSSAGSFAERVMWFCFGSTFTGILMQILIALGILAI